MMKYSLAILAMLMTTSGAAAEPAVTRLPPRGAAANWTPDQQLIGYRERRKIEPVRVVGRGPQPSLFTLAANQISPRWTFNGQAMDVDSFMKAKRVSGVIVVKNGRIMLERYGLGRTDEDVWDSQSVAKSVTAILIGAAIQDGYIKSMDDPIIRYIPELRGSAYDRVTIRQLLTMRSGIKWNESLE